MLHPAPVTATTQVLPQKPVVTFQFSTDEIKAQPMPDIIKNLCADAPVDLLTKGDSPLSKDWPRLEAPKEKKETDLESDSLSEDDSSHTETGPNQSVPRVEVHDEGGELIQLDSLMLVNSIEEEKASGTATSTGTTMIAAAESESSESGRDATTLALTETELSDWAAESAVLDDCGFDDKEERKRSKNPRTLSGPKSVHDAKNIAAVSAHVCGRTSPIEPVVYSNALEHFEFADEGEQDPSIETPVTLRNEGYMELVDNDYDLYSPSNDRSMNFIERSFTETVMKPVSQEPSISVEDLPPIEDIDADVDCDLKSPQLLLRSIDNETSEKSSSESVKKSGYTKHEVISEPNIETKVESLSLSELSPPLEKATEESSEVSPPLVPETPILEYPAPIKITGPCTIRLYSPAICRSASETFNRSISRSTDSPTRSFELSVSINLSSGSLSPVSPIPARDTTDKVQEIKREREEQTEVVRRLVLERLGSVPRGGRKTGKRCRVSPASSVPPPVPPPPVLPAPPPPPPPPRPAPPHMSLHTPSFSDPELARERPRKGIMKSISNYLNRRLGPRHKWVSEPDLSWHEPQQVCNSHKSTGALQEAPPVPPPPASYSPPPEPRSPTRLPAEQQAATVAELVQVSAQREAHQALMAADRRRCAGGSVGD